MAKAMSNRMEGWMPRLVAVEEICREIEQLGIQAKESGPFQKEIDHHETVRNHIAQLYQHTVDGTIDELSRLAHITFQKNKLENENGVAALFLILSDDFDAAFASAMGSAATKAYTYGEQAMGNANWGKLKDRAEEFSKQRAKDLENTPKAVLERAQGSILRGLAGKETPAALQRKLDEALREAKEVEGGRVAETEATITLGTALDSIMKAAGFTHKRWLSQRDDKVRHTHEVCDRQGFIPIGKSFSNGLRYPGDADGPIEELANCRCVLVGEKRK